MKRKKLINRIFWATLWVILSVSVSVCWHEQGCPTGNILVGIAAYGVLCGIFCYLFYTLIKERYGKE